jgi:hypothetical protein
MVHLTLTVPLASNTEKSMKYQDQDLFDREIARAQRTVRHTLITAAVVNCGCLLVSVAGVTCVILGCLKLFGVI